MPNLFNAFLEGTLNWWFVMILIVDRLNQLAYCRSYPEKSNYSCSKPLFPINQENNLWFLISSDEAWTFSAGMSPGCSQHHVGNLHMESSCWRCQGACWTNFPLSSSRWVWRREGHIMFDAQSEIYTQIEGESFFDKKCKAEPRHKSDNFVM